MACEAASATPLPTLASAAPLARPCTFPHPIRYATEATAPVAADKLDKYPSQSRAPPCEPTAGATKVRPRSGWRAVPLVPKVLGLSGLLPFYALCPPVLGAAIDGLASSSLTAPLATALLQDIYPYSGLLQVGYGASIVSFLGAVHWGAAMQSRTGHTTKLMFERYVWSVIPALVAFPAAATGVQTGSAIVGSALLTCFAIDAKFNWKGALLWSHLRLCKAPALLSTDLALPRSKATGGTGFVTHAGALPRWYMALRVPLTLGGFAAMLITFCYTAPNLASLRDEGA